MTEPNEVIVRPKIALFLPALEGGGAERVFVELANEFAAQGLNVDLVLASAWGPYVEDVSAVVRVIDFRAASVLRSLPHVVRYLRSERPDVLLSALDHANVVSILARFVSATRTRCVISVRSVPSKVYESARSIRERALFRLIKSAYPFADAIIANSEAVAADLFRLMNLSQRKLHVLYNPLNTTRINELSMESVDDAWYSKKDSPIVLGVGSLTPLKDFVTLIRAFAIVRASRDCRLVILGEGPERSAIESAISDLGLEQDVYLPGFINNPFALMRQAAVFVSSSLTEGCPNALMQALACGARVVSTDCVGGSGEILQQGKWGTLVPVGDAHAMADSIVTSLDADDVPDGRQRAYDFKPENVARQYLEVLLPKYSRAVLGD